MAIVTLTTDFGQKGYYVAALKGALLNEVADLQLIDVSHFVKPYDIVQGAFILNNAYHHFPKKTIHLVAINNTSTPLSLIAFQHEGQFFVGPDNGIFSLIFDPMPEEVFRLTSENKTPFPLNSVFAEAVAHLASGKPILEIGLPSKETVHRIALQPVISTSQIRGSVIYIDHYGNVIVNIKKDFFEKVRNKRRFKLYFKRHDPIEHLSRNYHNVPIGDTLCLFNDAGYLVIAINMGQAASLLGLKLDDMVQVDFVNKG